jgi:ribonuclease HI
LRYNGEVCVVEEEVCILFFDGSVCSQGYGVGLLVISPCGEEYEFSTRLEFDCTNNQAEYEALLSEIEVVVEMGARAVRIFGDSKLTVQQSKGESQCWDGVLNEYKEKCLEGLEGVDWFSMSTYRGKRITGLIHWCSKHQDMILEEACSGREESR